MGAGKVKPYPGFWCPRGDDGVEVMLRGSTEGLGVGYQFGSIVVYGWLAGCLVRSAYGEYRDMWE